MSTNSWIRAGYGGITWQDTQQEYLLAQLTAGQVLVRARFAWGFGGVTSTVVSAPGILTNPMTLGLVTTIGNGSETPPNPITQSGDISPPAQRWLWWEQRVPSVAAWDAANTVALWQSSPPQEPVDAHGMVSAPGSMGAGNTLDVWAVFQGKYAWDASGSAELWMYFNLLVRSP